MLDCSRTASLTSNEKLTSQMKTPRKYEVKYNNARLLRVPYKVDNPRSTCMGGSDGGTGGDVARGLDFLITVGWGDDSGESLPKGKQGNTQE